MYLKIGNEFAVYEYFLFQLLMPLQTSLEL